MSKNDFSYDDFKQFEHRNYAKIEFLSLFDEIAPLIGKELSYRAIYLYFLSKKRLSMKYSTFTLYMRKHAKTKIDANQVAAIGQTTKHKEHQVPLGMKTKPINHSNIPDSGLLEEK